MIIAFKCKYQYVTTDSNSPLDNTTRFDNVLQACIFMIDRYSKSYDLLINGRQYPWPEGYIDIAMLEDHLRECIDLDKAFYG